MQKALGNQCITNKRITTVLTPGEKPRAELPQIDERGVEEKRDADIKSTATFGKLSALPLFEESVFFRSTKRNETSTSSICAKGNKAFLSPKIMWNIPFSYRPPPACLVSRVFLVAIGQQYFCEPQTSRRNICVLRVNVINRQL
ncbi:hypothetical protein AVEN_56498-1 [Araneus ventricosus]|uniref:Uncharacterized protein n=1 Tax=Araneus ventricosus TaxID=182803 RepID=A0A4Y2N810_ARAVE|nr:hypothetical protein AVEN_56498-1 [Araneus ventricosus]